MVQNIPAAKPAAVRDPAPVCVCKPAELRQLTPKMDKEELAFCPFPREDPEEQLTAFQAAPHFRSLELGELFHEYSDGLRLILVCKEPYYARQAAMYAASLWNALHEEEEDKENNSLFDEVDAFMEGLGSSEEREDERKGLIVVASQLLDPELEEGRDERLAAMQGGQPMLDHEKLEGRYLLLARDRGGVLSRKVCQQLESLAEKARGVFIALRPQQVDFDLMNELSFKQHFRILKVDSASLDYMEEVFRSAARELGLTLAPSLRPRRVIEDLRQRRRERFDEGDIYSLLRNKARAGKKQKEYREKDLCYEPFDPRTLGGSSARDRLERMIGLEDVKECLRRQLAVSSLQQRNPEKQLNYYRSLTFGGPPGTGKSVTARLAAELFREEGCGSGRFVEAGREQLIGKFLGQTSIKVAQAFENAKGGVLFIDEAGALVDKGSGDDIYVTEAVNALVRHMELNPDTLVIFASYSQEIKDLLASNPGLSSRVAQQLEFPPYSEAELWAILRKQGEDAGLPVEAEAEETCQAFFRELKRRRGENFGNGREARRLFNTAVEEMATRTGGGRQKAVLTARDVELAAARLLGQEEEKPEKRPIGF